MLIADKGHIKRSGCLAAGVNAINAYLNEGETVESYAAYVKKESSDIIREDLTLTIGSRLNKMANNLEKYGLTIYKDKNGKYVSRGKRSIKINGESIKPILAKAVIDHGVKVINFLNIIGLFVKNGTVIGAYGIHAKEEVFYVIHAKAIICATGGAAGIYKPNNPNEAPHKIWYSPFNTGAGFAMGLCAGAEMTTFEMRFIALRTKDTISPTGTLGQLEGSYQVNAFGERYLNKYTINTTAMRLYATINEKNIGHGHTFLVHESIKDKRFEDIKKDYLSMSPSIVLKWADSAYDINKRGVEICGTEPYINGGHGQAGYWVKTNRETTLRGLYAAGDVVGGSCKKYVTGAMAEGNIAVESAIEYIKDSQILIVSTKSINSKYQEVLKHFDPDAKEDIVDNIESCMQAIMDEYAGGIKEDYIVCESKLIIARKKLSDISQNQLSGIKVNSVYQLIKLQELIERILIARVLVEHLIYRKETRWRCYQERSDYKNRDDENWLKFVNSTYDQKTDTIQIHERSM